MTSGSLFQGLSILRHQLCEQMGRKLPEDNRNSAVQPDIDIGALDETWPLLWTDDPFNFDNNAQENSMNMYLLGIPQLASGE
jgi:hypothetical protein